MSEPLVPPEPDLDLIDNTHSKVSAREERRRIIAAFLASPDAERALAEALEVDWTPFWNERRRGGVVEAEFDRPRFARAILAAWRERL